MGEKDAPFEVGIVVSILLARKLRHREVEGQA